MAEREFEIVIAPDGAVQLEVKGFKGRRCLEAAKVFQEIVGELQSHNRTAEFYEPEELVRYHVEKKGSAD